MIKAVNLPFVIHWPFKFHNLAIRLEIFTDLIFRNADIIELSNINFGSHVGFFLVPNEFVLGD